MGEEMQNKDARSIWGCICPFSTYPNAFYIEHTWSLWDLQSMIGKSFSAFFSRPRGGTLTVGRLTGRERTEKMYVRRCPTSGCPRMAHHFQDEAAMKSTPHCHSSGPGAKTAPRSRSAPAGGVHHPESVVFRGHPVSGHAIRVSPC